MKSWGSLLVLVSMAAIGCGGGGDSGPKRFRLSGVVNFDGKPVPAGTIYFEPATGPSGSAQIKNGRYDTNTGVGIVGGPHTVMIEGFDGTGANPGEMGKPIFRPFSAKEDFPSADSTKDFDIPATAAEGLVIPDDPA